MWENLISLIFSIFFVAFWMLIFRNYTKGITRHHKIFPVAFLLGIFVALAALALEQFFVYFFNQEILALIPILHAPSTNELFHHIAFTFILSVFIEETLKFAFIYKIIDKEKINTAADGMQIGLWLGFGFALIENALYFSVFMDELDGSNLVSILLVRGIVATLAHGLYGIIAGYYLSLNQAHKLYRPFFFKRGYLTCLIIHSLFNIFLIINLGYISIMILAMLLIIVLNWYNDRKNFQHKLSSGVIPRKPFLSENQEIEILASMLKLPYKLFLGLTESLYKITPKK